MTDIIELSIMTGLLSWFFTGILRRYAFVKNLMDVPNARSSHKITTPRGGGLAIVLVFLLGQFLLFRANLLTYSALLAFMGSGAIVAITGFWDDHHDIAARWRLLVHFGAATWGLYWLAGLPPIAFWDHPINLGWIGHLLGLFYLVWLLNLYNFMDGIDGLASIEAITVCLGSILIIVLQGYGLSEQSWELILLTSSVSGFLIWNFPPARIFMGDVGSGFLGIILGLISIQAAWLNPSFFWSWLCLLGVFIVDATWTLWRRFRSGEKLHEAHRSHTYQIAALRYGSHKTVTLFIGAVNLFWLLPWAISIGFGLVEGILGVALAYLPLLLTAIKFNAGGTEQP